MLFVDLLRTAVCATIDGITRSTAGDGADVVEGRIKPHGVIFSTADGATSNSFRQFSFLTCSQQCLQKRKWKISANKRWKWRIFLNDYRIMAVARWNMPCSVNYSKRKGKGSYKSAQDIGLDLIRSASISHRCAAEADWRHELAGGYGYWTSHKRMVWWELDWNMNHLKKYIPTSINAFHKALKMCSINLRTGDKIQNGKL